MKILAYLLSFLFVVSVSMAQNKITVFEMHAAMTVENNHKEGWKELDPPIKIMFLENKICVATPKQRVYSILQSSMPDTSDDMEGVVFYCTDDAGKECFITVAKKLSEAPIYMMILYEFVDQKTGISTDFRLIFRDTPNEQ